MGHHYKQKEYDLTATEFEMFSNKKIRKIEPNQSLMEYGAKVLKSCNIEVLGIGQNHITLRCFASPHNITKYRNMLKIRIQEYEYSNR